MKLLRAILEFFDLEFLEKSRIVIVALPADLSASIPLFLWLRLAQTTTKNCISWFHKDLVGRLSKVTVDNPKTWIIPVNEEKLSVPANPQCPFLGGNFDDQWNWSNFLSFIAFRLSVSRVNVSKRCCKWDRGMISPPSKHLTTFNSSQSLLHGNYSLTVRTKSNLPCFSTPLWLYVTNVFIERALSRHTPNNRKVHRTIETSKLEIKRRIKEKTHYR